MREKEVENESNIREARRKRLSPQLKVEITKETMKIMSSLKI